MKQRTLSVLKNTWKQMTQAQLFTVASSLAYITILSIIPLLALSFAIFDAFGGMDKLLSTIQPFILSNLAEGASEEVIQRLQAFVKNAHASAIGAGGFFGLIFTSMSMLSSIEKAIHQVWQTKNNRTWFQRFSTYWLLITLGPVAFSLAIGFATSSDYPIAQLLPSWTGTFLLTAGGFYCMYKYVPICKVQWRHALLSAVLTSIIWNIARLGYQLYTSRVLTYNKIYGSLGAIPLLLLWIYIAWIVVLAGAAFTAALQKKE
jgi:membrane protein